MILFKVIIYNGVFMVRNYVLFLMLISFFQISEAGYLGAAAQGVVSAAGVEGLKALADGKSGSKSQITTVKYYDDPEEFKSAVALFFRESLSCYGPDTVTKKVGNYTVTRELAGTNPVTGHRTYRITVTGANSEQVQKFFGRSTTSEEETDLGLRMAALMTLDKVKVAEKFGDLENVRHTPWRLRLSRMPVLRHTITSPESYVQCTVDRTGGVNRNPSCSFTIKESHLDSIYAQNPRTIG